mmetsp:Transcript_29983/g.45680  ORF Transcript_29983/g.45680 Transcript_29983/m.45680 type:complete len:815 (-) Transcript_29983:50-2494(-)
MMRRFFYVSQLVSLLSFFWTTQVAQSFGTASRFLTTTTRSSSTTTTCLSDFTASSTTSPAVEKKKKKNVFESYQKPIILVGSSGTGSSSPDGDDILTQLGNTLASQLQTNVISSSSAEDGNALDVLLFPMDDTTFQQSNSNNPLSSYYNNGYLLIYINVQGQKVVSTDVEDEHIVPFTDYELCVKSGDEDDLDHLEWELQRLVSRALVAPEATIEDANLLMGEQTFFCSLTFPKVEDAEPFCEQICQDVDAMEYRVDLLLDESRDSRFDILYGMQLLRKYCRPYATRVGAMPCLASGVPLLEDVFPMVYTVRTAHQAGTYPDETDEDISNMFQRLSWGLRGGLEVLDVESAWDPELTTALLERAQERHASTVILGSHHVVGSETADLMEAVELFRQCQLQGRAHGAKVVLSTQDDKEDSVAYQAGLIAQSLLQQEGKEVMPCISLMLGEIAQFSRVLNKNFTPVTHESLPFTAAPGQLTASELMTTRVMTKLLPSPKYYAILGHNIAYSVSPQMHNAAFQVLRLPYQYVRADVETVEEFVEGDFFKSVQFAGCSVTIPHKQSIMPYCDVLTDAAKAIGSVNTIIVTEEIDEEDGDGVLKRVNVGDNTDWKGIYNPLKRRLKKNNSNKSRAALVIGAGGTARAAAYAARQLQLSPIYFYNRTPMKAQALVEEFDGTLVESLEDDKMEPLAVIVSTLPQSVGFTLPNAILEQQQQQYVVLLDVNYKPYTTDLIAQVEKERPDWGIVRGSEMLWEQGVGQFELWTKRRAPYGVMKHAVLSNCLPKEDDDNDEVVDAVIEQKEEAKEESEEKEADEEK